MSQLLFFCIILTAFDLFLIVYALTIPLYPQKWRDKVNKKYQNETATGITIIFVTFDDGNVEAVMAVYRYKDGKIIILETGATPMPK